MKKNKVCFIASSGGHLQELNFLADLQNEYDTFLITEKSDFQKQYHFTRTYYVNKIDRKEKHFGLHFIRLTGNSFWIMCRERPDAVISSGALAAVPMLYLGKIFRKKIIFIESIARVEELSMTGKLVYPIADLFIVQWKQLLEKYPKAMYVSRLFGKEDMV